MGTLCAFIRFPSDHWIGWRENLNPETIDFPMKVMGFSCSISQQNQSIDHQIIQTSWWVPGEFSGSVSFSQPQFQHFLTHRPGDVPSPKAWCQAQLFGLCAASRVQRVGCQAQRTFVEGRDLGSRIPEVVRWIMVFWSRKLSIVGIWTSLFLGNLSFEQCSQAVNSLV